MTPSHPSRWLLLALICVQSLCFSSARCATTLTVNELPNPASIELDDKVESAVIRRFVALHPDIRLKRGTGLKIEGGANTMDMVPLMQIAGDISPDVLFVCFRLSGTYIERGFLRPLDDFVATVGEKELRVRVPPAVRDVCYREGPDGKKHWYMLPASKMVRALVYRRDLFAKAGLDPDRPPRTWREFEQYAKKLTTPAQGHFGMGFVKGDVSAWDFSNLVWSRGGDIIARNKRGEWEPRFNTPEVVDALYFYLRMTSLRWKARDGKIYRGFTWRDTPPVSVTASPGLPCAMAFDYLRARLNVYQPELVGYAPVPRPDNAKHSASEINCNMLGIYSGVKDPALARAAFDYIRFIDSDEANAIRVRMYIRYGYGRFINPDLLERFGYTDYLKQVDKEWVRVFRDVMVHGKPEPYGKSCAVVYRELSRPVEQALNDRIAIAALDRGDVAAVKSRLRAILRRAQAETAKRMYGTLPEPVRKTRSLLATIFLIAAAAGFATGTGYLIVIFRREAPPQVPGRRRNVAAFLLLFPAVASIILWQYLPLLRGTVMAFQDYNVVGASPFVGVQNFSDVLFDPSFWHSVGVTLLYTALYMSFAFVSPIVLALLLSEVPRGKMFFRTLFYLPAVLSGLVVIFLWKSFYKPGGLLNTLLGYLGISLNVNWLDAPSLAMASVLLPVIWAGMGPGSLIYLAAFKTIPDDLYEAADIDGAGILRKVFNVTLPSVKILVLINAVGAFMGAFMASEAIFAMTGGGPYTPNGATEVVGLQLFYTAFVYLKFGLANAMAWILGFMLLGFTLLQLKNLSRVEFKGGR